ncbi:MAG: TrkA family potassium uptake protein [Mycobacteriales bacterium]
MHYVIMGCGRVGSTLARSLEKLGHTVAVIDRDPVAFGRLGPKFGGTTVTGIGFDRDTLVEAGIERADALAAVSNGDNSNIITARVARETFGVDHVVARIYDPRRAEVYERLGIPTVATVRWTADRTLRALLADGAEELWRDPTSNVALIEVFVHNDWVGRPLADLETAAGARVAYVLRFGLGTLPTESTVVQDGDRVTLIVTDDIAAAAREVATAPPVGSS